ncbi:unnamed protein product [Cuscuta epithymum]|uniref:Uncharacterized protein n=1 Tax=Cuscuta epithymum TaxID=186058 RepID=A0AAV0CLW7_9ASTE|nr:unnamed protein product [Cuscuta epithymum]
MEVETSFGFSFEFSLFGLGSFVDKYKMMATGAEKEKLDLNKADVEVVADERRARPPPEPPPWSASKSRVWKKMSVFYFNSVFLSVCVFLSKCMLFGPFWYLIFRLFPVCKTLILKYVLLII